MIALIQRVSKATLLVNEKLIASINKGYLVLVSVGKSDTLEEISWLAKKIINLRIFSEGGKMIKSITDINGEILFVSQFTLHATTNKGKRPSFKNSADSETAKNYFNKLITETKKNFVGKVCQGVFGSHMIIDPTLDGPVTIYIDSKSNK